MTPSPTRIHPSLALGLGLGFLLTLGLAPAPAQEITFGPGETGRTEPLDRIVAVVDDDIITRSELESSLASVVGQLRARGGPLPPRDVLERQVLERLILQRLQARAAERNGVEVDDATLNAALEDIATRNNLTLSQLRETIRRDGFSFAQFRDDIRSEILAARLRQRVVENRIQVTDQEVENFLTSAAATQGNREYLLSQILIAVPPAASPAEVAAARDEARDLLSQVREGASFSELAVAHSDGREALSGGDLGWRRADQLPGLFASVVPQLKPGEVSEPIRSPGGFHLLLVRDARGVEAAMVTQTRARHILIRTDESTSPEEARLRVVRLRERILGGEDFADLARANSQDAGSATKGGELGWLSPGETVPPFEEALAQLQPGQISEPVRTRFGWHLVEVLERRRQNAAGDIERGRAREALFRRKSEEDWDLWLRRLRDEAYVEIRL